MSDPEEAPSRRGLIREVWIASAALLVGFTVLKHVGPFIPYVRDHVFTIAAGVQLYVPLFLIGKRGITKETLGLSFGKWKLDLKLIGVWALVVTVPFAAGHHFWMTTFYGRTFAPGLPDDFVEKVLTQVLVVGLAEELFYRGYLQERLQRIWPAQRTLFGAPFGAAIVVSCAVFALAHFVGEYRFDRLGPFFPGLLFGLLRARTGTIVSAVGFHAYCNLLGDVLWACYRP